MNHSTDGAGIAPHTRRYTGHFVTNDSAPTACCRRPGWSVVHAIGRYRRQRAGCKPLTARTTGPALDAVALHEPATSSSKLSSPIVHGSGVITRRPVGGARAGSVPRLHQDMASFRAHLLGPGRRATHEIAFGYYAASTHRLRDRCPRANQEEGHDVRRLLLLSLARQTRWSSLASL